MAGRNEIEVRATLKDDLTQGLKRVDKELNAFKNTLQMVQNVFAAGVAGQFIVNTVHHYASLGETLGKLKTASSLTYQQLQALQRGLEENGGSADQLAIAMRTLNTSVASGDKVLAKYGITAKTTIGAVMQIGQTMAKMADGPNKAELAMAAFGRASTEMIEVVTRFATDPEFKRGLEAVALSDEQVEKFQKLDERLDKAGRAWKRLFNEIAASLEPVASALLGTINLISDLESLGKSDEYKRNAEMRFRTNTAGALMFSAHGANARAATAPPFVPTEPKTPRTFYGNQAANWGYGPPTAPAGWGQERLRGMARLWGSNVSGFVNQPGNTYEQGRNASLERTRQAMATFSSGVEQSFQNLFSRVFSIQTRSNNVIVNLFADLASSIIDAVSQRFASAAGNFIVDAVLSFIPGGSAVKGGGGGGANTVINVNTLTPASLLSDALSPNGGLRQQGVRINQMAAIR